MARYYKYSADPSKGKYTEISEDEQNLIHAYYFLGMTQSEISAKIGESQQTISYRLGACMVKLRKFLKC